MLGANICSIKSGDLVIQALDFLEIKLGFPHHRATAEQFFVPMEGDADSLINCQSL